MLKNSLLDFLKKESATGILLIIATLFAMMMANSPLNALYAHFTELPVVVSFGEFAIAKPLLLWINDGLMAIFFFMVGLEIKREIIEGDLSDRKKLALPVFAAIGGMLLPALIYIGFNWDDPAAMSGWAIPAATDIAFALGILSLLGKRVPTSLKVFLLALAIIDDLGAIIIIALFYTSSLSLSSLAIAAVMIALLIFMNRGGVTNNTLYVLVGTILWLAVLKSGVHATLAGVVLGLCIPLLNNKKSFHELEHSLHTPVNFFVLPLFAFANTGVSFGNITPRDIGDSVTLGIIFGLFLGKQLGIFIFSALAVALRVASLPYGMHWAHLYGVAILSGVGFTMSLFIGSLAFECTGGACFDLVDERIGILVGSLLSGVAGFMFLKYVFDKEERKKLADAEE